MKFYIAAFLALLVPCAALAQQTDGIINYGSTAGGGGGGGGGSGCVPSGTTGQLLYNSGSGACTGITGATTDGTNTTFGDGTLKVTGASSGTAVLKAPATGGGTDTLPAGTDTLVGRASTDTLTNKSIAASEVNSGTLAGAQMPAYTGDVTSPANSTVNTLATVNSNVGSFGDATHVGQFTVNAKGLITAASSVAITANAVTWPTSADLVISNGTNTPAGLAPVNGDCVVGSGGAWTAGSCGSGGSVSISSASSNLVVSPNPITGTGTIAATYPIDAQTVTSYTIVSGDLGKLVTFSNASAVAVTVPQATSTFGAGASFDVQNKGAGTVTLTPTTSTINGASTLTVAQNMGVTVTSDGTNWQVSACTACISAGAISSVSNSDGTLTISPTTGAVVASLALSHANVWTALQTFAAVLGSENDQSGTTYTLVASDCGKTVAFSNASAVTVTVPSSIVPVAGTTCDIKIRQDGAGQVSVNGSATTPATLVSAHSYSKTFGQHAMLGLELTTISSTATAVLTGDGA